MPRNPFATKAAPAQKKATPRKKTYPDMSAPLGDIQDWMEEGFGLLSVVLAWVMVRKVQPVEIRRAARDELAMTTEEAEAIAEPAAKIFERSRWNKRYGKHVVQSNDYIKLGMALYDYGDRIWPFLKNGVTVHVSNEHPQPVQAQASNGHVPTNVAGVVPIANAA